MTSILTAYLAREILKTSCAVLLVLYVILLSNALGRVLADIADGDIPAQTLGPTFLAQSINLLSMLLPIAMFLGIVFTFGRMYKDHEIVVMQACGVGYGDFYRPVLIALFPFMIVSVYTSVWLNAQMLYAADMAVKREANLHEFQLVKPGQFNQAGDGELVFYMESLSEDKLELREIIISQTGGDRMVIETARRGRQSIDEKSGDRFLVIGPGERYEGQAGDNQVKQISFAEHGILMEKRNKARVGKVHSDQMTPTALLQSSLRKHHVEFHWRIAIPVTLLVLALLAVPLAYVAPRKGRYGKVGVALLVLIAYLNLMAFTRAKLDDGIIPIALNFWWVHLLFLLLTLALIYRRNRGRLLRRMSA
jgi:lipopolysaccharide export system permease protein